jgi:uncharacterized protein (DUF934 family)
MRQIIRRRELVADDVHYPGEPGEHGTRPVVAVAEFIAAVSSAAPVGNAVLIGPTDEVELLATHLSRLDLIVIDFPKPGDGRGYSQARLLRQRLRYQGELRARGVLKRDQLVFLARCGFDSFQLEANEDLQAALAGFDTFSVAYQEGSDELIHLKRRDSSTPLLSRIKLAESSDGVAS